VPRLLLAAEMLWLAKSGANSVPPTARNVPQSPGATLLGYSSYAGSPV